MALRTLYEAQTAAVVGVVARQHCDAVVRLGGRTLRTPGAAERYDERGYSAQNWQESSFE